MTMFGDRMVALAELRRVLDQVVVVDQAEAVGASGWRVVVAHGRDFPDRSSSGAQKILTSACFHDETCDRRRPPASAYSRDAAIAARLPIRIVAGRPDVTLGVTLA
jgi:hypothetical protein